MPSKLPALLDLKSLSINTLHSLFSLVRQLKSKRLPMVGQGETVALLFFEPSTRTRMSFETAAVRAGYHPMLLDGGLKSSLEKGESIEDTILNVAAMEPRFLVIRCHDGVDLQAIRSQVDVMLINAGWGVAGHPTQALLDIFTMLERLQELKGRQILFLGDVRHSRVATSHFELLSQLGVKIALCGPTEFLPLQQENFKIYANLEDGLKESQVVMALRCQFERHSQNLKLNKDSYHEEFGLTIQRLKKFSPDGLIMHPGPINHGVEMDQNVLSDSRCVVLHQVTNGVFVREALLRMMNEGTFP